MNPQPGTRGGHCGGWPRSYCHARAQKNELKPHQRTGWVIPPARNAAFVANMEDILEVYRRPYDPKRPVVCLDEQPVQLVKETRQPLPAEPPGQPARYDYEYERAGTAVNFMITCQVTPDYRPVY